MGTAARDQDQAECGDSGPTCDTEGALSSPLLPPPLLLLLHFSSVSPPLLLLLPFTSSSPSCPCGVSSWLRRGLTVTLSPPFPDPPPPPSLSLSHSAVIDFFNLRQEKVLSAEQAAVLQATLIKCQVFRCDMKFCGSSDRLLLRQFINIFPFPLLCFSFFAFFSLLAPDFNKKTKGRG